MNRDLSHSLETSWKLLFDVSFNLKRLSDRPNEKEIGLKATILQSRVMSIIFDTTPEGVTLKDLAQKLRLPQNTTSKTADSLVKIGLLKRTHDRKDRRAISLHLTENGKALHQHVVKILSALMNYFLADIPLNEQIVFLKVLEHVRNQILATFEENLSQELQKETDEREEMVRADEA